MGNASPLLHRRPRRDAPRWLAGPHRRHRHGGPPHQAVPLVPGSEVRAWWKRGVCRRGRLTQLTKRASRRDGCRGRGRNVAAWLGPAYAACKQGPRRSQLAASHAVPEPRELRSLSLACRPLERHLEAWMVIVVRSETIMIVFHQNSSRTVRRKTTVSTRFIGSPSRLLVEPF